MRGDGGGGGEGHLWQHQQAACEHWLPTENGRKDKGKKERCVDGRRGDNAVEG